MKTLYYKKIFEDALPPVKRDGDACWDVFAHTFIKMWEKNTEDNEFCVKFGDQEHLILKPNERCMISTGLKLTVEEDYEIQVRPRSGNSGKKGLEVVNSPGTVDETYRGPVCVILKNGSNSNQIIVKNDKIAQLKISYVEPSEAKEVKELPPPSNADRGEGGFGSTGEK